MKIKLIVPKTLAMALVGVMVLGGCTIGIDKEQDFPEYESRESHRERIEGLDRGGETVFGEISLGGEKKRGEGDSFSTVNYFLWRATAGATVDFRRAAEFSGDDEQNLITEAAILKIL